MKNKEDQQTQFRIDDGNKHHVFTVEFDGETYRSVVPSPFSGVVGAGFVCEADAWKDIVVIRSEYPCAPQWKISDPTRCAQVLWESLGDIPINSQEEIECQWLIFDKGTPREAIWQWFEEIFEVSVAEDLMNLTSVN